MKPRLKAYFAIVTLLGSAGYSSSFPSSAIASTFFDKLYKNDAGTELLKNLTGKVSAVEPPGGISTILTREGAKRLAWSCPTRDGYVLIFDPREKSWPGDNAIIIALTKKDYELIDCRETGGQAVFEWAEIHDKEDSTILRILSRRRSGGTLVERFDILPKALEHMDSQSDRSLQLGTLLHE